MGVWSGRPRGEVRHSAIRLSELLGGQNGILLPSQGQILEREGKRERTLMSALSSSLRGFHPVCLKAKLISGALGASKGCRMPRHVSVLQCCVVWVALC